MGRINVSHPIAAIFVKCIDDERKLIVFVHLKRLTVQQNVIVSAISTYSPEIFSIGCRWYIIFGINDTDQRAESSTSRDKIQTPNAANLEKYKNHKISQNESNATTFYVL